MSRLDDIEARLNDEPVMWLGEEVPRYAEADLRYLLAIARAAEPVAEWLGGNDSDPMDSCQVCGGYDKEGHKPNCIGAALRAAIKPDTP